MIVLSFFIIVSIIISYIDITKGLIPDKIVMPSFAILIFLKYFESTLSLYDPVAVMIVVILFIIPIALNMAFGGGDVRFGAFCALFVGLESVGYFVLLSGLVHLVILMIVKKKSYPFAPAMSLGAIGAYVMGVL